MPKYLFCSGGVASSIGKGVAAASLGAVFEARGCKVNIAKLDPYINVDPGTMNPHQHGEVFVTADGAETDLDLGHYERFLNRPLSRANSCTAGQIYDTVIKRERRGDYLGATVQVIPHITDEIKQFIRNAAQGFDLAIIEIGGTVGDIESLPFLEAVRQLRLELPLQDTCSMHVTLVPYISSAGEYKTKPTQHSVKELREIGIQADILLCRTASDDLPDANVRKIALFANLPADRVFALPDAESIYQLPQIVAGCGLDAAVCQRLELDLPAPAMNKWLDLDRLRTEAADPVAIGLVGKYANYTESYKSLVEALTHAGWNAGAQVEVVHIDPEELGNGSANGACERVDGILVPGAFGSRGIEGKLSSIATARRLSKPYLGICIGMQLAIVEHARSCGGLPDAASAEFDSHTDHPVIQLYAGSEAGGPLGGTMRLGDEEFAIQPGTLLERIYGGATASERHRHRYEFNPDYRSRLEDAGMVFAAWSRQGRYCEAVELPDHPWFLACQFHPEYKSGPMRAHPIFTSFIAACRQA